MCFQTSQSGLDVIIFVCCVGSSLCVLFASDVLSDAVCGCCLFTLHLVCLHDWFACWLVCLFLFLYFFLYLFVCEFLSLFFFFFFICFLLS